MAESSHVPLTSIHRIDADGVKVFYRDAGRHHAPNAVVQLLDTGHFARETHVEVIADAMREFLAKIAR